MARILMVSAEASPFASTGGLGDVLQGLPRALTNMGHDVAVVLPLYTRVRNFHPEVVLHGLRFAIGNRAFVADIAQLEYSGVRYIFLDLPEMFNRNGIYGEWDADYPDNVLRYAAFCSGVLGVAQNFFRPDVIHCHDWHAGMVPVILAGRLHSHPALMSMKTIFTIHNLAFQGPVSPLDMHTLQLNGAFGYNNPSVMRGALETATRVTTVSPSYAKDICSPAHGCGLDEILMRRGEHLLGILNGIDTELWNPASDPYVEAHFSKNELSGKSRAKAELLAEFRLPPERVSRPLIGVVARLVRQKGLDLLSQNPQQFLDLDATLIICGDGNAHEEDFFRWMAAAHPERVAVKIGYDSSSCHRIIAGSDVFLMPSRYEPCGLTQLYAMRYGTLPLVHATGGLKDTVSDETGFCFHVHSWRALLQCLKQMTALWGTEQWTSMQQSALATDYSWAASAAQYSSLYLSLNQN